jgi:hypothetical protein
MEVYASQLVRWARLGSTLLLAGLVVAACSQTPAAPTDRPAGSGATGDGTRAALEEAARSSFLAFLSGDDESYFNLLSRSCREEHGFAAVASYLVSRRFRATQGGGVDLGALSVASVATSDFSGGSAQVSLAIDGTAEQFRESQPQAWVFEDDGWHQDECADVREGQGGLSGDEGTDRSNPLEMGALADVGDWYVSLAYFTPDFESTMSEGEVEPAPEGHVLVAAQVLVGYNGAEPSVVIGEHLAFAIVSPSVVYGDAVACVSLEYDDLFNDRQMEAAPGQDLPRPLICRAVPVTELSDLLLRVTDVPSGTEYWFDLVAP